jgi:dephospho-CoA kinase
MLAVGLTGGIGSGKSTVAAQLLGRGALLVDADQVAREVVAPGGPAYEPLVARFGRGIVAEDGSLDRPALAKLVFGDPQALADLNGITHPAIGATMLSRRLALARPGRVLILDIPLLRPAHRGDLRLDGVAVVDCPVEVAVGRLVQSRGMDRADAAARIAAQITREERLALVDFVLDNSSTLEHLTGEVDRLWTWIGTRPEQSTA